MSSSIIGWAHTKFGRHENETVESLTTRVTKDVLCHSKIDACDVDEIFVGHFNYGLDMQGIPAALPLQADEGLRFTPATHVENACASGSAAIHLAARAIESGQAKIALAVGVEKMTHAPNAKIQAALSSASYYAEEGSTGLSFAGIFAEIANGYFEKYGDHSNALAIIAAKNHRSGAMNPLAHMQKDLGYAFCSEVSDRNPMVAAPLRRTDCSLVTDGAAAILLASDDYIGDLDATIRLKSISQVCDFLPMSRRDMTHLSGAERAWKMALESANLRIDDLDFVETHDCFTIAELMQYEAMGLAEPGQAGKLLFDRETELGGRLPVNLSGGLKSKGHPIGATGVSMHVLAAMQLSEQASGEQAPGARLGGVFNMGGAAVANYCTILERIN
jgi:acetyl-CoA C-acetyltransferase